MPQKAKWYCQTVERLDAARTTMFGHFATRATVRVR